MHSPDYQRELESVFQKCRTLVTVAENVFPEEQGTNNNGWWFNFPNRRHVDITGGRWTISGDFRSTPHLSRFEVRFKPTLQEEIRLAFHGLVGMQFDPTLILEQRPNGKYIGNIEYWPKFGNKKILDLDRFPSADKVLHGIDKQLVQKPTSIGTILVNPDFIQGKQVAPQDEVYPVVRPAK